MNRPKQEKLEDNKSNEVEGRELMEPTRSGRDQISATGTFVRLDRNRIYQRGEPCGPFFAPFSASTAFARLLCLFRLSVSFLRLFCVFWYLTASFLASRMAFPASDLSVYYPTYKPSMT